MDISKILELSATSQRNALARHAKLAEECGELAEALLHSLGYLPHKTMKEPIEGEAADVIICVLDLLKCVYNDMSNEQFAEMIQHQLKLKAKKWEAILRSNPTA